MHELDPRTGFVRAFCPPTASPLPILPSSLIGSQASSPSPKTRNTGSSLPPLCESASKSPRDGSERSRHHVGMSLVRYFEHVSRTVPDRPSSGVFSRRLALETITVTPSAPQPQPPPLRSPPPKTLNSLESESQDHQ